MSELLIELFCEEIPAMMQKKAANAYKTIFANYLKSNNIAFESIDIYAGTRRLTIYAKGIPSILPAKIMELKGPKIDAPVCAIEGFCKSNNITKDLLSTKEIKGQEFYIYNNKIPPQNTSDLLKTTLEQPIAEYVWPKSMCWGDYKIRWIRPLKNIMCVFDGKVVAFNYGHLVANNNSFGHRFMSPAAFEVSNFSDYETNLRKNFVVLDHNERQEYIAFELQKAADKLGLLLHSDLELLEEVAGLVEYPQILVGSIDKKFLSVPSEILVCSMRANQKYFSLFEKDGKFAPFFLFVSNIDSTDKSIVIQGNERVLSARLSDALYFYNQDLKITLKDRLPHLEKVIFHAKIGSIREKVDRLVQICADFFGNHCAAIAASICKSDIVSEVVGEFPSLQGIMGYYYSKSEGLDNKIAMAIADHYKPQGPSDQVPTDDAAYLAIADKIDTLCSLMLSGQKPSGSKDPYALRRQALGIMRIIIENKLDIRLTELVNFTCNLLKDKLHFNPTDIGEVISFLEERAKHYFKDQYGYDPALIGAVLDLRAESNLLLVSLKLSALQNFLTSNDGANILSAYKRVNNILGDFTSSIMEINEAIFVSEHEINLMNFLNTNESKIQSFLDVKDYRQSLELLAHIKQPLTNFFDNIMVRDDNQNVARNRLLLLRRIKQIFDKIAKFELL